VAITYLSNSNLVSPIYLVISGYFLVGNCRLDVDVERRVLDTMPSHTHRAEFTQDKEISNKQDSNARHAGYATQVSSIGGRFWTHPGACVDENLTASSCVKVPLPKKKTNMAIMEPFPIRYQSWTASILLLILKIG